METTNTRTAQTSRHQKKPSPLQELIAAKHQLRIQAHEQEQQVSEQWHYIRKHSGHLVLSGFTGMLFPHRKHHHHRESPHKKSEFWENITDNLPYYLAVVREGLSVSWHIIRPFYLRWLVHHRK